MLYTRVDFLAFLMWRQNEPMTGGREVLIRLFGALTLENRSDGFENMT
jgi:hypothetical protein